MSLLDETRSTIIAFPQEVSKSHNLPVDIAQKRIHGGKILTSVVDTSARMLNQTFQPRSTSGWYLLFKSIFARKNNRIEQAGLPNIGDIILTSMLISSRKHEEAMINLSDYCVKIHIENISFLNFKQIHQIIEVGYESALEQLSQVGLIK